MNSSSPESCEKIYKLEESNPSFSDLLIEAENLNQKGSYDLAIEKFTKLDSMISQIENQNDPQIINYYLGLGLAYFKNGEISLGLKNGNMALEKIKYDSNHSENPLYGKCLILIGDIEKDSDINPALQKFDVAYKIFLAKYGNNHLDTLKALNMLGEIDYYKAQYKSSYRKFSECLKDAKKLIGTEDDEFIARIYNNLAATLSELNPFLNNTVVIDFYQKSLQKKNNVLGPNHPDIALSCYNLAQVYMDLDRKAEALEYMRKAITIHESNNRANHPLVADAYSDIGNIFNKMRKSKDSIINSRKSIKISLNNIDLNAKRLQNCMNQMAITTMFINSEIAMEYIKKAYTIGSKKKIHGQYYMQFYRDVFRIHDNNNKNLDLKEV